MHDEIDVVQEDPLGDAASLHVAGLTLEALPEPLLDRVRDGQGMAAGRAVADDEVIGEDLELPEIEDQETFGLLVLGGLDAEGEFRCQRRASFRYSP